MNTKGGCGATLLACNVAHALVAVSHRNVTLVDLDLQFGAIPVYFDLFPKRGLLQALENLDRLDEVAFKGYVVEHASGLKVLGNASEDALPTQPVSVDHVRRLLDVAVRCNDHLVVDLPRRIDAVAALVLERAQNIVLVVQQSLATLRDATRLITCMRDDLGVSKDRLLVVVNRYDKKSEITVEDIRTTLACGEVFLVPNDFRTVSQCVNTGTPLLTAAQNAAITRAVLTLQLRLGGVAAEQRSLLARTFSGLRKASST
jgi:pilus assembly protein CpaE